MPRVEWMSYITEAGLLARHSATCAHVQSMRAHTPAISRIPSGEQADCAYFDPKLVVQQLGRRRNRCEPHIERHACAHAHEHEYEEWERERHNREWQADLAAAVMEHAVGRRRHSRHNRERCSCD